MSKEQVRMSFFFDTKCVLENTSEETLLSAVFFHVFVVFYVWTGHFSPTSCLTFFFFSLFVKVFSIREHTPKTKERFLQVSCLLYKQFSQFFIYYELFLKYFGHLFPL